MGVEPLRGVKSSACATGRISFSFADFEEKRTEDAHGLDETKLLITMATRCRHLTKHLKLRRSFKLATNGVPLPVAIGVLRSLPSGMYLSCGGR